MLTSSLKCRLVHHAEDKCAFIKANCIDEEAGLFSYLSLYYCRLRRAKALAFAILSIWLALLFTTIGIAASDFFCINLNTIASILGMSESLAGTTFLAFGNGSPDVFSTFAAMSSKSGNLAVGELIGAASFITAVVVGSMALVTEFRVGKKILVRDVGFFIIAASLTIIFLADGLLSLWESCFMVGYYLFYVLIVVAWHWHRGSRGKKRESDAVARGHYTAVANEEPLIHEPEVHEENALCGGEYRRDMEEVYMLEHSSFSALVSYGEDEENRETNHGIRLAAEVTSNMRVTRPTTSRRSTITPIRPSLVGALEFRSALSSYTQRSRRGNSRLSYLRQSNEVVLVEDSTEGARDSNRDATMISDATKSRAGAATIEEVLVENAAESEVFRNAHISNRETTDHALISPKNLEIPIVPSLRQRSASGYSSPLVSPRTRSKSLCPATHHQRKTSDSAPLLEDGSANIKFLLDNSNQKPHDPADSLGCSSRMMPQKIQPTQLRIPSRESSPSRLSSVSTFPAYFDPLYGLSVNSNPGSKPPSPISQHVERVPQSTPFFNCMSFKKKLFSWRPCKFLPSPQKIGCTLFPTLCRWDQKTIWDKFVSVISAPSIFLLAITLPVVDSDSDDLDDQAELDLYQDPNTINCMPSRLGTTVNTPLEGQAEWLAYRRAVESQGNTYPSHQTQESHLNLNIERFHQSPFRLSFSLNGSIGNNETELNSAPLEDWDRWLVSIQIFTAPIFVVVILWANNTDRDLSKLTKMIFYSTIGSIIAYLILVLATSSNRIPKHRFVLCFLGFIVSIAWISTIASEVVGVLKAIGVILEISDAILGLTVFAVGNSLGDLVADITMARLGYPVMALSACFGGPMLNILLGIGLSGIYVTVNKANKKHDQNPANRITYRPFEIEVSRNLMISAATLLVSLAGILISLPLNKWVMGRRIGWGLITLWLISNTANLLLEISGW